MGRPITSSNGFAGGRGISLNDVYFTVFRHKRRILLCSCLGFLVATALYRYPPPPFQSEAKLFVRYVVETRATGSSGENSRVRSLETQGETVLNSELQILTSLNLLRQVVDAVGADKIAPEHPNNYQRNWAALGVLSGNFTVEVAPQSRVLHLMFKHRDRAVVQPVLRSVIDTYLKDHVEIHRAIGITGDFLSRETDELRSRLRRTEEQLHEANQKVGAFSIEEAKRIATEQRARIQQEILTAQADYAERQAILQYTPGALDAVSKVSVPEVISPQTAIDDYKAVDARIAILRRREQELLVPFTSENSRVKEIRAQLAEAVAVKRRLETEHPALLSYQVSAPVATDNGLGSGMPTVISEATRLRALQSKIEVLHSQLDDIKSQVANIEKMEVSIQELRRKKELEEANYRYYAASLEQSRIDDALGAGHVSNISEIQSPSPPRQDWVKRQKLLVGIAAAGVLAGLAWAFTIEQVLDRTIKRPGEIERHLQLPLFLSIPETKSKRPPRLRRLASRMKLAEQGTNGQNGSELLPWDPSHALYPFHETLRDRLIAYFESINLTHKPKLVAVTGMAKRSGVTTIAAGLAQRLSETGEGKVLLVDMTASKGSAQQFFKGTAIHGLDELLDTGAPGADTAQTLYVATEAGSHDQLSRNLPQRFSKLVPKLKASDFDYIIFDMPPVSQISVTPRLAGFMDMVLLVIESEKSNRDMAQRATMLLLASQARVGTVLNRVHNYVPAGMSQDSVGDL